MSVCEASKKNSASAVVCGQCEGFQKRRLVKAEGFRCRPRRKAKLPGHSQLVFFAFDQRPQQGPVYQFVFQPTSAVSASAREKARSGFRLKPATAPHTLSTGPAMTLKVLSSRSSNSNRLQRAVFACSRRDDSVWLSVPAGDAARWGLSRHESRSCASPDPYSQPNTQGPAVANANARLQRD